eukprot:gene1937-2372_t
MVTAYDYCSGKEVDRAGIDIVLVGDSLGMVILGEKGTVNVTMDQMIHHCKATMKGVKRAFVVGDMPFGSFETSPTEAVANAIRIMKEGGVDAIKLEGGRKHVDSIKAIVKAGIPVMGHIGLTPQSVSALGGFKLQGKTSEEAMSILEDALALQEAGCFALVIEMTPEVVASSITKLLKIPTIGIGAGGGTSGQVLVYHDMLGIYSDFVPKFCKQYSNLSKSINDGLVNFKKEIEDKSFPSQNHSFSMKDQELNLFFDSINSKFNSSNNTSTTTTTTTTTKPILDFESLRSSNTLILNNNLDKKSKNNSNATTATAIKTPTPSSTTTILSTQQTIPKSTTTNSFIIPPPFIQDHELHISSRPIKKPKVVVIGAGAMGSLFSAKLASNDLADVWMVSSWKEHVEKINRNGLTLYGMDGKPEIVTSIKATLDALDVIKDGYPDLALVLVKSHSTKQASITSAKMVGGNPNAVVLTLQNGVGNREEIESTINEKGYKNKVWQGVTSNGAIMVGAGVVKHTGFGPTYLASASNKSDEFKLLTSVSDILNGAGITSELTNDVDGMVWGKVVVNAAINPLSAVLGVPNGYLVENEYSKNMMKRIIGEGMEVCKAKGIKLPYGDDFEEGYRYAADIATRTSTNYSSMLQDVIRGQPTEIKSINGVIVTEGERLEVDVAYNKMIMEMVLSCYNKKRDPSLFLSQ